MKKLLCAAVAPVFFLASCASVQTATNGASASGVASTSNSLYCWKDRLLTEGDNLTCNWAASTTEACKETTRTNVSKNAIVGGPVDAKRCDNGQWLVHVTKK